ncbi:MAG: formiminoglutamase [Glaciecola sp.]|jgi:formiminoglutamase
MSLGIYLHELSSEFTNSETWNKNTMGASMCFYEDEIHSSQLNDAKIAIVGVEEVRGAEVDYDASSSVKSIRKEFYCMFNHFPNVNLMDLGDVKAGNSVEDTYYAVSKIVEELVKKDVIPIVLGGSQDLTFASYKAYEALEQSVNIVTVDPKIDMGVIDDQVNESNYINHIVMHQPNYLFNYSSLAYQSYYTDDELVSLMEKLNFDSYRLGYVKSNIEEIEPVLRSADILSFDINAIKSSDAPGTVLSSPNGLSGEDSCRIFRYAGLSDKLTAIGVYNYSADKDYSKISAKQLAQMLWYFIDGVNNRKQDYPVATVAKYIKYHVDVENEKLSLVFYKSPKSGRWWVEVPYPEDAGHKHAKHLVMPCSYNDYLKACEGEIPERWWQSYHKLIA